MADETESKKGSSDKACLLAVILITSLIAVVAFGAKYIYTEWVNPTMQQFSPQIEEAKKQIEKGKEYYETYKKLDESGVIEDAKQLNEDVQNFKENL